MQNSHVTQSLTICMWYNTPNPCVITEHLNSYEPIIKGTLRGPVFEAASGHFTAVFQFSSLKLDEYTHTYTHCQHTVSSWSRKTLFLLKRISSLHSGGPQVSIGSLRKNTLSRNNPDRTTFYCFKFRNVFKRKWTAPECRKSVRFQ